MGEKTQKYGKQKAEYLTAKEIRFCRHYVETNNATQSIKLAGFKYKNDAVASVEAFRILRYPKIRQYINELRRNAADAAQVTFDRIVQQWSLIAFGDRKAVYREDGTLKEPNEWDKGVEAMIAEVESIQMPEGNVLKKVKFERRPEALKELMRILEREQDRTKDVSKQTTSDVEVLLDNPDAKTLAGG